jgi:DNA topoisomerase-1
VIKANTETLKKEALELFCTEEPRDEKLVEKILKVGKSSDWKVTDISETETKRSARAPFITSTLQQTASSRLGFAPSRTMGIAQKLYESGYITYMRTDSTNLSKVALAQIYSTIEKKYGKEYLEPHIFASKSKNAQEAHEAVRPTDMSKTSLGINDEQKKLYELIWQRTMASQMTDAKMMRTKITASTAAPSKAPRSRSPPTTSRTSTTPTASAGATSRWLSMAS